MEKIKVLAIMGEAGSGKDTVATRLVEMLPDKCCNVVSYTTRPKREGETNGVNYWFVSEEEYKEMTMFESTCFNSWYYGSALPSYNKSKVNVVVMNPESARALRSHPAIDLKVVRLQVSPKERLMRQLARETNPNVTEIIRRWGTDEEDFVDVEALVDMTFPNETSKDLHLVLGQLGFMVDNWPN